MIARARRRAESLWRRTAGPPLVLGHRGARREAPENTLAAFRLAVEQGAAGVELDVRLDGDDEPVVIHDPTLERVSGGKDARSIELLASDELAEVRLDGEPIPTLRAVLEWAALGGHLVNVELKRDVSRRRVLVWRVAKLVASIAGARDRVLFSSFDPMIVRSLAWLSPEVPVAWLVHGKQRLLKRAPGWKRLGAAGVNPELALATDGRILRLRSAGALVNVWTVNQPEDARRLARAGVDGIISDVPGEIVRALG